RGMAGTSGAWPVRLRDRTVPCNTRGNVQAPLQPRASTEDDSARDLDPLRIAAHMASEADGGVTVGERIASSLATLTAAERTLADHLVRHRRELAYASAAQVARELGVSASTAVRFAQTLGF